MRSITQFGRKVTNWQLLLNNLEPHVAAMPQVQPLATELQALAAEVREIDSEQEIARGRLRELTQRRQEAERRGETLRSRVGAVLRGSFGFTSKQLIQFGFSPRPTQTRPRKKSAPTPAPTPKPAPNSTPDPTPAPETN